MNKDSFTRYLGVNKVQIRTLRQLHEQLDRNWHSKTQVELARTGIRKFHLGDEGKAATNFVFDRGWSTRGDVAGEELKRRNSWLPAPNGRIPKLTFLALALMAVLALAVLNAVPKTLGASDSKSFQNLPKSSKSAAKKPLAAIVNCTVPDIAYPVPPTGLSLDDKSLKLLHDVTIGGEREQEVEVSCGNQPGVPPKRYEVRFWLDGHTWKAKSATPLGSHSRLG